MALAFVMAAAFQVPVHAAQSDAQATVAVQAVDEGTAQASVQATGFTFGISSVYYDSSTKKVTLGVTISTTDSYGGYYQVQVLNYKKKVAADKTGVLKFAYFQNSLSKNKLYYIRVRRVAYSYYDSTNQKTVYTPAGNWVYAKKSLNTAVLSAKYSKGKVKIKVPKVKGMKKMYLYMSTKRDGGYKKVKTVKPGKTYAISKFKKKKLKKYKTYYCQVRGKNQTSGFVYSFWIRTVYR